MSFESLLIRTIALFFISIFASNAKTWFSTRTAIRAALGTLESMALFGAAFGVLATTLARFGYRVVVPVPTLWNFVFIYAAVYFFNPRNLLWQIFRITFLTFAPIMFVGFVTMGATDPFNTGTAVLGVFAANFAINFAIKLLTNEIYYPTYALLSTLWRA